MASELIAGDEAITEFVLRIFRIEDPVLCIWVSEAPPGSEEVNEFFNKYGIDFAHFFSKEQFHSLFFPNGYILGEWNLVLAGVKEDMDVIQPPATGLVRGWMMGTDIEKLTITIDI